tara:strand:+ start:128 stop:583 length:456 start_codon:yes stop_codon:yes gene_type:complete
MTIEKSSSTADENERLLTAFHQIAHSVLSPLDQEEIVDTISWQILQAGIFRSLMIALVDEKNHRVRVIRNRTIRGSDGQPLPESTATERMQLDIYYDLDDDNITAEVAWHAPESSASLRNGINALIREWTTRAIAGGKRRILYRSSTAVKR